MAKIYELMKDFLPDKEDVKNRLLNYFRENPMTHHGYARVLGISPVTLHRFLECSGDREGSHIKTVLIIDKFLKEHENKESK